MHPGSRRLSTHRGTTTPFYELIRGITKGGNPMGFSHHNITLHQAVRQGIVECINKNQAATSRASPSFAGSAPSASMKNNGRKEATSISLTFHCMH